MFILFCIGEKKTTFSTKSYITLLTGNIFVNNAVCMLICQVTLVAFT